MLSTVDIFAVISISVVVARSTILIHVVTVLRELNVLGALCEIVPVLAT